MRATKPILLLSLGGLLLAACADPMAPNGNQRTQQGAVTGAVIGGLLGATRESGNDRVRNAAVGAGLGAIAGTIVGNVLDKQAAELQAATSGNVQVVNTGNELVVRMPQDLLFATDSATLRPDLQRDLVAVAQSLNNYPNSRVDVIGHTDNTGEAAYNADLSQRRASSVASVLIGSGVAAGRIAAYGRGEDQPIATNATAEGRAQNRRVEIIIRPTN